MGMGLTATILCIPNSIKFWFLWKETKKQKNLAASITYAIGAFFLVSGVFVVFIKSVWGCPS